AGPGDARVVGRHLHHGAGARRRGELGQEARLDPVRGPEVGRTAPGERAGPLTRRTNGTLVPLYRRRVPFVRQAGLRLLVGASSSFFFVDDFFGAGFSAGSSVGFPPAERAASTLACRALSRSVMLSGPSSRF